MLGSQCVAAIILVLIVYMLIGILHDWITEVNQDNKEALPMKTKSKNLCATTIKSILNSVWTVGANLLAGALLA